MYKKNDSDLFFCCSLIEFIGRECNLKRIDVVNALGEETVRRIYDFADVLHCEPIAKNADVYIEMCSIIKGDFDNISTCKYDVPSYWTIGKVYSRVIENILFDNVDYDIVTTLFDVYSSFVSDSISFYNSDFFYQSREYIYECYKSGTILL